MQVVSLSLFMVGIEFTHFTKCFLNVPVQPLCLSFIGLCQRVTCFILENREAYG